MGIFERYAPFVQDFIYEHSWESLRAIQVAAADAIFNTDENVLLTASTASGKTEAAFFPILTEFWEDPPASVGALYIGPLKALINDQFYRLEDLCAQADIPVWHWHGDVAQSHKARMLKHPSGILQITPESLEALLMRKHALVPRLFCDLRYVVIDEVHSLLRADRGGQTLCLIERLSRMAGVNPRRIGLSATVGEPELVGAFLAAGTGRGTVIPQVQAPGRTWRLSMEHFYNTGPQASEVPKHDRTAFGVEEAKLRHDGSAAVRAKFGLDESAPFEEDGGAAVHVQGLEGFAGSCGMGVQGADGATLGTDAGALPGVAGESADERAGMPPLGPLDAPTDTAPALADPGMGYIFEYTRGKKCLVFVNSREEAEAVCTTLRQYCEAKGEPDRFLIHHGNLSASYRETAEAVMKDDEQCQTTVTTATLELGIDIGRLERAFQIDAPFTVSSFLQRMGRTGRRGEPQEMRFVMREEYPEPRALMPETIPWKLLQGIALVQLYTEERWVEPPLLDRLPFSLLFHQTMATLASEGEMTPARLAQRVLSLTYFHRVTQDDYRLLLRHLLERDFIEWTEGGGLIVGIAGERVVNSFKFYAVFQENEEYTVRSESQEVGTIVAPPPAGEKIAIAGHVWVVDEVDHKRHLVYCTQVKGKVPAYFGDVPGDINTKVLERMLRVLAEDRGYPYLMKNAVARLRQARHSARAAGVAEAAVGGRALKAAALPGAAVERGACAMSGAEENGAVATGGADAAGSSEEGVADGASVVAYGRPLVNLGGDMWCLFPWLGTYAFLALERMLKRKVAPLLGLKGIDAARPYYIQFKMTCSEQEFFDCLAGLADEPFDLMDLLFPGEVPYFEKYDGFLPEELVRRGFAYGVLDVEGAKARIRSWGEARVLPEGYAE